MPKRPRHGSLQFWPRKRAGKQIPSVNWKPVESKEEGILGFITYKVGMASVSVLDSTPNSMTKGKKIIIPATILEAPNMKVFSVRFYKYGIPMKDVVVSNDKELKKKLKVPKTLKPFESQIPEGYDDIRIIVYSLPNQTSVKKTPDLIELALSSSNKLDLVKSLISKEISPSDFLKYPVVDVRAVTKGKGLQGPVKRFGINLRSHKSEKGVRKAGSIAPWHPARVTYMTPVAGQMGMFSRITNNQMVLSSGSIKEKDINPGTGFRHYGKIKTNYILVKGSVHGVQKRAVLLTPAFRPSKEVSKKKFEFQEILQ